MLRCAWSDSGLERNCYQVQAHRDDGTAYKHSGATVWHALEYELAGEMTDHAHLTTSRPRIRGSKSYPALAAEHRSMTNPFRDKGLPGCFACATRADGCAIHRTRADITYQFESAPITHARSGVRPTAGVGRLRPVGIARADPLGPRIDHRLPAPAINTGRVRNTPRQLSRLLHWRERFASRMYCPHIGSLR